MKKCWEGRKVGQMVTYATMITADGTGDVVIGVYRGKLKRIQDMPTIDANRSVHVGSVRIKSSKIHESLRTFAKRFETPDAPVFDFGRYEDYAKR